MTVRAFTADPPWFVAVGASGPVGLDEIAALLLDLCATLKAVVLIVLQRPLDEESHFRAVLSRASQMPVVIASQGQRFQQNTVYIGEPAEHLTLAATSFGTLVSDPERWYANRTLDLLLHSLAEHAGPRGIGMVLSGFLDDGSRGLAAIHHAGGLNMVLEPGGSPVEDMPKNAIAYDGPIDAIASPEEIARAIVTAAEKGRGEGARPSPPR